MRAPGKSGFKRKVTAQAGECAQTFEHDPASSDGRCLWPVRGESLRDGIRVDELLNGKRVLQQIGGARAFASAVWTGEHHDKRHARCHVNTLDRKSFHVTVQSFSKSANSSGR